MGQLAPGHGKAKERIPLHHAQEMGEIAPHLLMHRPHNTHLVEGACSEGAAAVCPVNLRHRNNLGVSLLKILEKETDK